MVNGPLSPSSRIARAAHACYPNRERTRVRRDMNLTMAKSTTRKAAAKPAAKSVSAKPAIATALRTLDAEASGLAALARALQNGLGEPFAAAVDVIMKATDTKSDRRSGKVIVTGLGKSGHVARKIAATLASTGTPAFFVHAAEASHGDLGMIGKDDVIVSLSWSGEQPEMKNLVNYSARFRIPFIAITSSAASPLGQAADIVLELPKAREACPHNLAPTTSSLMQLAIGDALAIALLEGRGFTAIDFKLRHPGGKLGAMLRKVHEFMHTGDAIPLKPLGTSMKQAVAEISAKGFGCVGITDKSGALVGIITDGDLRRHLGQDLAKTRVDDIMTRNPRTIAPDVLASEAVAILNGNSPKITVLLVIKGVKPVGIVHVHDFLQAGVV